MSRLNKVNKDAYNQRGRLTPDEIARERMNQAQVSGRAQRKESAGGKARAAKAPPARRPRRTRGASD